MADLQEVDGRQKPSLDEESLDRRSRIPRQQRRELAMADDHHDRAVVDVLGRDRPDGIGLRGIHDLDRCRRTQREGLSGTSHGHRQVRISGDVHHEPVMRGVLEGDGRVEEAVHAEAIYDVDEPGDVVLVRVREHDNVDLAIEEGQVLAEPAQCQLGVRPAVNQHRRPVRCFHQDGVSLADVEHGDVEQPIRPRDDRDRQQHGDQPCTGRQRPCDPPHERSDPAGSR